MKIIIAIGMVVWFLLLGGSAYSGAVNMSIRSGEHKNFSRLVFEFTGPTKWSLIPNPDGYLLHFLPAPVTIDLRTVFKFVPRTRLRAVSQVTGSKGGLQLFMPQGEIANAWEISPDKLVIDIKKGSRRLIQRSRDNRRGNSNGSALAASNIGPLKSGKIGRSPPSRRSEEKQSADVFSSTVSPEANGEIVQRIEPLPDMHLLKARRQLVVKLARAMTDGLISSPYNILDSTNTLATIPQKSHFLYAPNLRLGPARGDGPRNARENGSDGDLNIEATTAFDSSEPSGNQNVNSLKKKAACIDPSFFALGEWYSEMDAAEKIANLRSRLLGEFDRIRPAVLKKLVRLYIVEGFGTEARELIDSYNQSLSHPNILKDLATLLEVGQLQKGNGLSKQIGCPGASHFWGFLAQTRTALVAAPSFNRLAKTLASLPIDLRMRVGTIILSRLVDNKQIADATEIVRVIERAPGVRPPEYKFEKARFELLLRHRKIALRGLAGLAYTQTSRSDRALLLLLQENAESGAKVSAKMLIYAGARAFQLRFAPLGTELLTAVLSSTAKQQKQSEAFQTLYHERKVGVISTQTAQKIADGIFLSYDINNLNGPIFVSDFFKYKQVHPLTTLSIAARQHIAKALLAVSLPEIALEALGHLTPKMSKQDRILLGRIYLQLDRPMSAISAVKDLPSPNALSIRQTALERSGSLKRAADMLKGGKMSARAQDLAWRASRWGLVRTSDIASRRLIASERMMSKINKPTILAVNQSYSAKRLKEKTGPEEPITFESYQKILKTSRTMQVTLETLMADHPGPKTF